MEAIKSCRLQRHSTKAAFVFCAVLLLCSYASAQTVFSFTSKESRQKHDRRLIDSVIVGALAQPLSTKTERQWRGAFWAMELMLYRTNATEKTVSEAWNKATQLSEEFQKALLEVSYTLYPNRFAQQAEDLMDRTSSPAVFVRCAEYLLLSHKKNTVKQLVEKRAAEHFAGSSYPGLEILKARLKTTRQSTLPPLADLFNPSFLPGETVIFSLHRANRNYPGLVLIRNKDGSIAKGAKGEVFAVPQLARSITAYPFYITNGNTPQGIYRWTGFNTSTNNYIGPTTNLQMSMPFEVAPDVFFNDSTLRNTPWTASLYAALLPASWRQYAGIYESYKAGEIGRSEIIMHGTAINPVYYKGQNYFPQTPSLGCLCSLEEWDAGGRLKKSDQEKIVAALCRQGSNTGYVVVIDLDKLERPVTVEDVQKRIFQ